MDTKDVEQIFNITQIHYVKVLPYMFLINGDTYGELYINAFDIIYIRKYWKNGTLICYSMDCNKGKGNKNCKICKFLYSDNIYHSPCQLRLKLSWIHQDEKYCMELPNTGIKNFIKAYNVLNTQYKSISTQLKLYVMPRYDGKWGEVRCEICINP